jgi:hypothetical protein
MSFIYSTGFKNFVCADGSVKDAFDGMVIKVYSAPTTIPDNADEALPSDAVLLCTYSDASTGTGLNLAAASVNGVISKDDTQVWSGVGTNGVSAFFRAVSLADDGTLSTSALRIQGRVGVIGSDLNVSSTTYVTSTTYALDYFSIAFAGA